MSLLGTACKTFENEEMKSIGVRKETFKTESIKKLSNFTFQCTKTLYQNNFKHSGFFFTFFEGYKCNKLYEITLKKRFLWES